MALIPNLVISEAVEIDWGNAIRDRVVHIFATAAEQTAAFTSPNTAAKEGQLSWRSDLNLLQVYNGSAWVAVPYHGSSGALTLTGAIKFNDVSFPTPGANQGGYIQLSPDAGDTTTWGIDNYDNRFRIWTGANEVITCGPTDIDLKRATVARSTLTVAGAATMAAVTSSGTVRAPGFHVDNSLYMSPTATAGVDMRPNGPVVLSAEGENHHAYLMGDNVYLRTNQYEDVLIQSGHGGSYTIAFFRESGGGSWRSHFACPIPVLGGGSAVTIQGLGNDQFGRVSSSRRYKINVEPVSPDDLMAAVSRMRPVTFNDNPDALPNATEEERLGMIAEEMAEIDERLVVWGIDPDCDCDTGTWADDDPKVHDRLSGVHTCWRPEAIDYGRVTVPLIGAVQALSSRLAALESTVSALVAELTAPEPEVHPPDPEAAQPEPEPEPEQQQLEFEEKSDSE